VYSEYEALKFERRGKILVVTIDNPPMNATTRQLHNELSRVFTTINRDPDTAVVILTGGGDRAFSVGGDIKEMARRIESQDHQDWIQSNTEGRDIIKSLLRIEKPGHFADQWACHGPGRESRGAR
jgi:enoyl-CoA hydratase